MHLRILQRLTLAIILIVSCNLVLAAEQSPGAGSSYERMGTIEEINLASNRIIINDRSYGFAENVQIRENNRLTSRASLSKGMRLGFNFRPSPQSDSGSVITEIWILR